MKKLLLTIVIVISGSLLSACNSFNWNISNVKEELIGRDINIQTYDENSQLIDRVSGNSVSISPDKKFGIKDSEGNTVAKSPVLNITVGGKQMIHVGSSLIAYDKELPNIFESYNQKVDIDNFDKSVPFINRMVNELKNITTGKGKVILIRSQSGKPLATFIGNKVSTFATEIDKSTGLLVDDKYLFIYRCDYTIYDTDLLTGQ